MVWAAGRDNRRLSGHPLSEGLFKLRWRRFDFVLVSVPSGLITAITVVPAIGSGRRHGAGRPWPWPLSMLPCLQGFCDPPKLRCQVDQLCEQFDGLNVA